MLLLLLGVIETELKIVFLFRNKRTFWPRDQEARVRQEFSKEIASRQVPNMIRCMKVVDQFEHCNGQYRVLVMKVKNLIAAGKRSSMTTQPNTMRKLLPKKRRIENADSSEDDDE